MECSNLPGIVACAVIPLMGGWKVSLQNPASSLYHIHMKIVSWSGQKNIKKKKTFLRDMEFRSSSTYQSKSWKFLTKSDENRWKMSKNDEKREKMTFFQDFLCFECKNSKKYEIEGAPAPKIAYFYTTVEPLHKQYFGHHLVIIWHHHQQHHYLYEPTATS